MVNEQGTSSLPSFILDFTMKSLVSQVLIKFCTSTHKTLPSFFKMIVGTDSACPAPRALAVQPLFCTSDTVCALATTGESINVSKNNSFFIAVIKSFFIRNS